MVSKHHVYHAIHHNLTIKKPRSAHSFSQKPSKTWFSPAQKNYGRYFAGIGFVGVSESQKMFATQYRSPSFNS